MSNSIVQMITSEEQFNKELDDLRELHRKGLEADTEIYKAEISDILTQFDNLDENKKRVLIAGHFINMVKKEMGHGLVSAGIFGSTSRFDAKEKSDIDIMLYLLPITKEEVRLQNNLVLVQSRRFMELNSANNSYRIAELEQLLTEKTGIRVASYSEYIENEKAASTRFIPIMLLEEGETHVNQKKLDRLISA